MRNIMLTLSYIGTNYSGWQIQKNAVTICETIQNAIFKITREEVSLTGCSRTDAGVHALNYVANFKTSSTINCRNLKEALNTYLPHDISISSCDEVGIDFNSRFSALKKTYIYKVYLNKTRCPFLSNRAWHYKYPLDLDKMKAGGKLLIGKHDFKAFMSSGGNAVETIREIYDVRINKYEDILEIAVTGNGFLYNMVRIIAGTLVYIGANKLDVDCINDMLSSGRREMGGITAPPHGLYLKDVVYREI